MLNTSNMQKVNSMKSSYQTNCWGSTQFALNHTKVASWSERSDMENFLSLHSTPVNMHEIKTGDILVMRDLFGTLLHTALYMGNGLFWHKPGSNCARNEKFSEIRSLYTRICSEMTYSFRRHLA